jgi:hypothetical protein
MKERELPLDLGPLCNCCDFHNYKLPGVEGITPHQRLVIEAICQLCVEHCERKNKRSKPAGD